VRDRKPRRPPGDVDEAALVDDLSVDAPDVPEPVREAGGSLDRGHGDEAERGAGGERGERRRDVAAVAEARA